MTNQLRLEIANAQGWDLDAFDAFRHFASENRPAVQFELCAHGVAEGRALHTRASTGPYTLGGARIDRPARDYTYHVGAHLEVEAALGLFAPTDRPEATEVVLAALTACVNAAVMTSALDRGIRLSHLETRAQIAWDPSVFLHLKEATADGLPVDQFGPLRVELQLAGDDLSDGDIAFLRESVNRSAVFNLLRRAHYCEPKVSLRMAIERAT